MQNRGGGGGGGGGGEGLTSIHEAVQLQLYFEEKKMKSYVSIFTLSKQTRL